MACMQLNKPATAMTITTHQSATSSVLQQQTKLTDKKNSAKQTNSAK